MFNEAKSTWENYSSLMKAAHRGDLVSVTQLYRQDPSAIDTVGGWNTTTALMLAAKGNHLDVVKFLVSQNANLSIQNELGNTALTLAAEQGNIDIVKELIARGANIHVQNIYGQTALILATENGHLDMVRLLTTSTTDPQSLLTVRNKYDKTALLVAAQLGKYDLVQWMVTEHRADVNIVTTERGMSCLMYACSYSSDAHEQIVDLLIAYGANVNAASMEQDTPLFWAAISGRVSVVAKLIKAGAKVNQINKRGFTALMKAAERGNESVVRCLIENGADKWIVNGEDKDAMKLAWLRGQVDMATRVFMTDDDFGMLSTPVTTVFTEEELDELGLIYSNPTQFSTLKSLVSAAAKYDFHFDLFIRLLPRLQTPNSILNKQLPIFYQCFYERSMTLDVDIVYKLVQLAAALAQVQLKHPLEKIDFKERNDVIMAMLVECVSSDCMEEEKHIREILCFAIKWEQKLYRDELVEKAQTFRCGLLEACVRYHIKAIFSSGHISAYVANLFWGFLRQSEPFSNSHSLAGPFKMCSQLLGFRYSVESQNIRHLTSNYIHVRYCPAIMFIGEGVSKLLTLMLVTHISILLYFERTELPHMHWEELLLAIMTVSMLLYECGELCENDLTIIPKSKVVWNHFTDVFNWFDVGGLALLVMWLVFKLRTLFLEYEHEGDRVFEVRNFQAALATSAIVFSMGLLRYFSLWEPLGKLTIMVFAMMSDLASFAIFFLICIFGFCVALFSLFRADIPFFTTGQTALTLFSATLNNYDASFDSFEKKDRGHALGIVILVIYILLSSVVLMNLVVARMAATHQKIDERSFQEWQFSTARTVKQFLLFEEKNPLCMLPAPLNILPTILFPVHSCFLYYCTRTEISQMEKAVEGAAGHAHPHPSLISIAGSASDVFVGIVFSFIAPLIELGVYLFQLIPVSSRRHRLAHTKQSSKKLPVLRLEALLFLVIFPLIYPFFVIKLIKEACSLLTRLSLEHTGQGIRRIVEFKHRYVYRLPVITSDDIDILTVKILRGERIKRCFDTSNVAVKVRLDDMELCTGTSIYRGCDPVFSNEVLQFPLKTINFASPEVRLCFEVVDKDILTGFETVVGECAMSHESILAFVSNGRFEERIALDNAGGFIVCVGKVEFPSFLQDQAPATPFAAQEGSGVMILANSGKAKLRKTSYKESYASFRKRAAKVTPICNTSSDDRADSKSSSPVVVVQPATPVLPAAASISEGSAPTLAVPEESMTHSIVKTFSNSHVVNEMRAELEAKESGSASGSASSPSEEQVKASPYTGLPTVAEHKPSLIFPDSSRPLLPALKPLVESPPAMRFSAHSPSVGMSRPPGAHLSPPTDARQRGASTQSKVIFTKADKDRIFYHALRQRGFKSSQFDTSDSLHASLVSPDFRSGMLNNPKTDFIVNLRPSPQHMAPIREELPLVPRSTSDDEFSNKAALGMGLNMFSFIAPNSGVESSRVQVGYSPHSPHAATPNELAAMYLRRECSDDDFSARVVVNANEIL